jgi:hypothetical protein
MDSVTLLSGPSPLSGPTQKEGPSLRVTNIKLILALFLIFVLVVSDVFTVSILASFGEKAVHGRNATSWGTVLQGIFVVIFYAVAAFLIEHRVL